MLMYGFHLRRNEGKHLSVGGTVVNQVMAFPSSRHSDALRGDLPYDMGGATNIKVFIADDLPGEPLSAARVHRVDLEISGERNGEAVRLTNGSGRRGFRRRSQRSPGRFGRSYLRRRRIGSKRGRPWWCTSSTCQRMSQSLLPVLRLKWRVITGSECVRPMTSRL